MVTGDTLRLLCKGSTVLGKGKFLRVRLDRAGGLRSRKTGFVTAEPSSRRRDQKVNDRVRASSLRKVERGSSSGLSHQVRSRRSRILWRNRGRIRLREHQDRWPLVPFHQQRLLDWQRSTALDRQAEEIERCGYSQSGRSARPSMFETLSHCRLAFAAPGIQRFFSRRVVSILKSASNNPCSLR